MGFFGAFTTKTLALDVHSDMGNIELFFQSLRVSLIAPRLGEGSLASPMDQWCKTKHASSLPSNSNVFI